MLTGANDEGTRAAVGGTRAQTTSDDGQRAVAVTEGEKAVVVDVAIVFAPVVATVQFAVASAGESELVCVTKGTVFETLVVCSDG